MLGSLLLTTLVIEVPFIAKAFGFTPIGLTEYAIAMGLAFLVIPIVEIVKFFQRKAAKKEVAKLHGKDRRRYNRRLKHQREAQMGQRVKEVPDNDG